MNIFLQKNGLSANFLPFFLHLTSKNNINNNKEGKISDENVENCKKITYVNALKYQAGEIDVKLLKFAEPYAIMKYNKI